ncbi:MAG: phosphatidylserine/phosphatidylglycerophosphate/cardiolipin synthase family protein [Candidatus Sericytochromatia bacterium]|nr:phosphatidylserine/phosphatidylglycerophosphate/cardiolipin synthase family protein [Candidatus Sericytochromatia bacterium]
MKIFKSLLPVVVLSLFLNACGSASNLSLNNSSSSNTVKALDANSTDLSAEEKLTRINNAIDFSTSTKTTSDNYNLNVYIDGPQAYPALEDMILNAKKNVFVEVFEYHNDATGKRITDALVKKAKEGVNVKFLYDFIGNSDVNLMNYMSKNGVHVETYGKEIKIPKVTITHRKIYIIDGVRAMTGGMNIDANFASGGLYHDILMNFEGDAAKDAMNEFFTDWIDSGGKISEDMKSAYDEPIIKTETAEQKYNMRLAVTNPVGKNKREDIYKMFLAAVDASKIEIKVAMPYFTDDVFVSHLISAKNRGVKVTALIPNKTSITPVTMVNKLTANQLIKAGIDVYRGGVKDGSFNHSKVMTIDGVWSTIGSCNADYRAFHSNQELNVAVSSQAFTENLNKIFFDRFIGEATKGTFENIPWYKKPVYSLLEDFDRFL